MLISFSAIHAEAVAAGTKTRTIRSTRRAKPGDTLQLYAGARTKAARKLCPDVTCTAVTPVSIWDHGPTVDGAILRDADAFARLDGFATYAEMAAWFADLHGPLPFHGWLHEWHAPAVPAC